jgi:hypothetical protein
MIQKINSGRGSHRKERKGRKIEDRSAADIVIDQREKSFLASGSSDLRKISPFSRNDNLAFLCGPLLARSIKDSIP